MFKILKGDITKAKADVIINASNTELLHIGGVALAIKNKAGSELIEDSKKIDYVEIGSFAVTRAGNLNAKEVFHIPTICYRHKRKATIEDIKTSFKKALKEAVKSGYKKIATPLLGTGVVGLDEKDVENALREVSFEFKDLEVILYKI